MKPSLDHQHTFEYMNDESMVKLMEVAEDLGRVGRVRVIPPGIKSYTSLSSNTKNKKPSLSSNTQNKKISLPSNIKDEHSKILKFSNGDTFIKVRKMINQMRSKVKPKFARKNKKG